MDYRKYHKDTAKSYASIPIEFMLTRYEGMVSSTDAGDIRGEYQVNSYGYRSPEFDGAAELVTLGCSQTFGTGVQNGTNWPYLLSEKLGLKLANLAVVGSSIQMQLDVLLSYMNTYGKPKVVVLLAPGLERLRVPVRTDTVIASNRKQSDSKDLYDVSHTNLGIRESNIEVIPSYAKKPYDLFDILPYEFAVSESIRALSHINMICKINGIKFVFASWHPIANPYLTTVASNIDPDKWKELDMSNYVEVQSDEYFMDNYTDAKCHDDPLNDGGLGWNVGTDPSRHMGRHHHLHIAETFYDKLAEMEL